VTLLICPSPSLQYIIEKFHSFVAGDKMAEEQEQLRQHWQELAEQLGLEPVEQTAQPSPPTISPKEDKTGGPQPSRPDRAEPAVTKTEVEESFARNQESISSSVEVKSPPAKAPASDQFVSVSETSGNEEPSRAQPTDQELRPERRGRQGRRPEKYERGRTSSRRRTSGRDRPEEAPSVADHPSALSEENPELPSEDDFSDEPEPAFVEEPPSTEDRKEDDDSDYLDTLSDWNVPSWAELIASLYRPER
jgi:hypothetical protein